MRYEIPEDLEYTNRIFQNYMRSINEKVIEEVMDERERSFCKSLVHNIWRKHSLATCNNGKSFIEVSEKKSLLYLIENILMILKASRMRDQ